jgi:hypothetical protein
LWGEVADFSRSIDRREKWRGDFESRLLGRTRRAEKKLTLKSADATVVNADPA